MTFQVTVLCENTVPVPGLIGEHGFAALVETPDDTFLFDTGQGFGLVANALRLKKDLQKVSRVVLSHGHFDHTGGLLAFLGVHGPCDIVAHPDVLLERFRLMPMGPEEKPVSIGLPWREAYLVTRGARFKWETSCKEIGPGVWISGEVPRKTPFETGDPKFKLKSADGWVQDPFRDDYSLALQTGRGLVVILGCAHAGLINILNHFTAHTGENRIHAVLGGTHLGFSPPRQLEKTIEAVRDYHVERIAVSHCTGQQPVARLAQEFGDNFAFAPVGFVLEA